MSPLDLATEISLYKVLGIESTAQETELRSAYRRLARETHPDVVGGDREAFEKIHEAYELLSDPVKRKKYDAVLGVFEKQKQQEEEAKQYHQQQWSGSTIHVQMGGFYSGSYNPNISFVLNSTVAYTVHSASVIINVGSGWKSYP